MNSESFMPALLVLNPGSASIKWTVFSTSDNGLSGELGPIAQGQVGSSVVDEVIGQLIDSTAGFDICALVVRIVHGGATFFHPVEVTIDNIDQLMAHDSLAPLHNKVAIDLINSWRQRRKALRIFAVFDTQFFADLPLVAQTYALPNALIKKHQIRRYGFHGFAHQDMLRQWRKKNPYQQHFKLVTAQLGSGCSMAAIRDGKALDTSMGFTPNEGLLMRTRCGDIDPGLLTWLQQKERWPPEVLDNLLNCDSGWHGLSGGVDDMAELFASDHPQCRLAFDLFCYRIQKTLGAYFAILGGLDGVVLSGGIAENSGAICRNLLTGLSHLGIELSSDQTDLDLPLCITAPDSAVQCWVVHADEAGAMLHSVQQQFNNDFPIQPLAD